MSRFHRVSAFGLALLAVAAPAFAQGTFKNGWHEDTKHGFKLKIPAKWEGVPVSIDDRWVVAQYMADRPVIVRKGEYSGHEKKPELRVIVFSDEARASRNPIAGELPYKDYKDFYTRNQQAGGFYFSKEDDARVGGMDCKKYEIKFEKLTVPRRVVTWVFRGDAADYAVEFDVLEDGYEKLAAQFVSSLQSFKLIKRDAATIGVGGGTTGAKKTLKDLLEDPEANREKWKELSAKERTDRRKQSEAARIRAMKDALPAGWTTKEAAGFLIISHASAKETDRIASAAEACRGWLDATLSGVSDDYAMRPIIRICGSYDEYSMYMRTGGDTYSADNRELVTYHEAGRGDTNIGALNSRMLNLYLYDKHPGLVYSLPAWLRIGLDGVVSSATPAGKTLKLGPDNQENTLVREFARGTEKVTARDLMNMTAENIYPNPQLHAISTRLARYFLTSKKDFIANFLKASGEVEDEMDKESGKGPRKVATTEEEEEAELKARKAEGKERAAERIKKIMERACPWSDKEWQAVESAFAASLK